ncbi:hypothetical protein [Neisseria sp. Ec49-e6-T10]|uniref:hypothetical protein n=1 Tax=Neisseria sp. Ec49-e6-T10 TaxID=3140744 RepID=UPI003EBDA6A1
MAKLFLKYWQPILIFLIIAAYGLFCVWLGQDHVKKDWALLATFLLYIMSLYLAHQYFCRTSYQNFQPEQKIKIVMVVRLIFSCPILPHYIYRDGGRIIPIIQKNNLFVLLVFFYLYIIIKYYL